MKVLCMKMQQQISDNQAKILKRLELIKNLISLEDIDEIESHLSKIKAGNEDTKLLSIIESLKQGLYSKAFALIEEYIQSNYNVMTYADPYVIALKLEIKTLTDTINELDNEKAETEKLINDFLIRHNRELGDIIIKVLKFKKEVLEEESKTNNSEEKRREYAEAERDYEEYQQEFNEVQSKKQYELTGEELKELKQKFKQASKLCHPDLIDKNLHDKAHKIFMELKEAYDENNLKRVSEILGMLENGNMFVSKVENKNEAIVLQVEAARLRQIIIELTHEIEDIKSSDTYKTIENIVDWDNYFMQTKEQLSKELQQLENKDAQ